MIEFFWLPINNYISNDVCCSFAGTSTGKIIAGILLAGLATSLITPISNKPTSAAPTLQPINLDFIYGHELAESLKLQTLTNQIINAIAIPKNDSFIQRESVKRMKRSLSNIPDCQAKAPNVSGLQACYQVCYSAYQSSTITLIEFKTCLENALNLFNTPTVNICLSQNTLTLKGFQGISIAKSNQSLFCHA